MPTRGDSHAEARGHAAWRRPDRLGEVRSSAAGLWFRAIALGKPAKLSCGIHVGQPGPYSASDSGMTLSLTQESDILPGGRWAKVCFSTKRARVAGVPGSSGLVFVELPGLLVLLKGWQGWDGVI